MGEQRRGRRRSAPPVALAVSGLVLLALLIPSALSVPQNRLDTQVAFAPVPPDREPVDPPAAPPNLAAPTGLGELADGRGGPGGPGPAPTPQPVPTGTPTGRSLDSTCVQDVVGIWRQTADPMSPRCVPKGAFTGDNGGQTALGITPDGLVTLVLRIDSGFYVCDTGDCQAPAGRFYDTSEPTNPLDPPGEGTKSYMVREIGAMVRHLNDRYELWGRRVRVVLQVGSFGSGDAVGASDAREALRRYDPFGVVLRPAFSSRSVRGYVRQVVEAGRVALATTTLASERELGPLAWSHHPTSEHHAQSFAEFVCKRVAPYDVAFSGDRDGDGLDDNGGRRAFAVLRTIDPGEERVSYLGEVARRTLADECNLELVDEHTFDQCCATTTDVDQQDAALGVMARFRKKGVTTVLWLGGHTGRWARAARDLRYEPEWVLLGDDMLEGWEMTRYSGTSSVWDGHAIAVTYNVDGPAPADQECGEVVREAVPNAGPESLNDACETYTYLRTAFTAVQAAGPFLHPATVERGLRGMHPVSYRGPLTAACRWEPGEHFCVRDVAIMVYDATGLPPGQPVPGCFRGLQRTYEVDGTAFRWTGRYEHGQHPSTDVAEDLRAEPGPCSFWTGETHT